MPLLPDSMKKFFPLVILLVAAVSVQAETRYVSDKLEAPLRAGASLRYKILRLIPSGMALTVVQTDAESGYALVRTPEGTQGWIETRALMDTPAARDSLMNVQKELDKVTAENALLKKQINAIAAHGGDAKTSFSQLLAENERLNSQLIEIRKINSGDIDLNEQNRTLQERVVNLERELQITQQDNQFLRDNRDRSMFMAGAAVLLGGVLLGLTLTRLRWRKRENWGDL